MDYIKDKKRVFFQIISLPIIFGVFIPIVILDMFIEFYHRICFALYGLKYVKRSYYIKIDRQKLDYLRWYQKIGCAYCGYVNGLVAYWVSIAGKTEKYWCGIMHKKTKNFYQPEHHKNFTEYDNREEFMDKYIK